MKDLSMKIFKIIKKYSTLRETRTHLLFNYIYTAFGEITVRNCNNWFNRVRKHFTKCKEKEYTVMKKFIPRICYLMFSVDFFTYKLQNYFFKLLYLKL